MKTLKQRAQRRLVELAAYITSALKERHQRHVRTAVAVIDRNKSVAIRKALWVSKVHRKSPKHVAAVVNSARRYW